MSYKVYTLIEGSYPYKYDNETIEVSCMCKVTEVINRIRYNKTKTSFKIENTILSYAFFDFNW